MAFVNSAPYALLRLMGARSACGVHVGRCTTSTSSTGRTCPRMAVEGNKTTAEPVTKVGPIRPEGFREPEPRIGYIRPDSAADVILGAVALLVRGGAGAFIEGYTFDFQERREYSKTLPKVRPKLPIRVFEFEACPFCRKVREAISLLDLDVLMFPCPKGGKVYREYVKNTGGKNQFPYIEDPNTGYKGFESMDIIEYLYKTYGPQAASVPFVFKGPSTLIAGIATAVRGGRGRVRESATVPAPQPLELYGYESSPFGKLVRERLNELEVPYMLYTTPRGSPTRQKLKELAGRVQTPYLIDPNTDVKMFESVAIVDYLNATYGPKAKGAVETPPPGAAFLPPFIVGSTYAQVVEDPNVGAAASPSLNPTMPRDELLEEYCKDNPETDECRVYEE